MGTGEESLLREPRGRVCAHWGNGVTGAAGERGCQGDGQLTAVGWFVTAVHTVIVPVTDPDAGDAALGD